MLLDTVNIDNFIHGQAIYVLRQLVTVQLQLDYKQRIAPSCYILFGSLCFKMF